MSRELARVRRRKPGARRKSKVRGRGRSNPAARRIETRAMKTSEVLTAFPTTPGPVKCLYRSNCRIFGFISANTTGRGTFLSRSRLTRAHRFHRARPFARLHRAEFVARQIGMPFDPATYRRRFSGRGDQAPTSAPSPRAHEMRRALPGGGKRSIEDDSPRSSRGCFRIHGPAR